MGGFKKTGGVILLPSVKGKEVKDGGREDVPVGVSTEDVLDDNNRLLHHVVDFGLDQLKQHVDAAFRSPLELDRCPANGADGAANKVHIDLLSVLLQLQEDLLHVSV